MEILDKIYQEITLGHVQETRDLVREALDEQIEAQMIVNQAMLPAVRFVGEGMRNECMDLPRLLAACKAVRMGLEIIEESGEIRERKVGTVLLGTVEGDLHDVGKNLVALMLRSEGIEVIDLGVDVSEKMFLKAIREHPETSIICLSSLLTTSVPELVRMVKILKKVPGRKYKIMIGGGAVTEETARSAGADAYTENAIDAAVWAKEFLMKDTGV